MLGYGLYVQYIVVIAQWQKQYDIIYQFLIFYNLFHESLGDFNFNIFRIFQLQLKITFSC